MVYKRGFFSVQNGPLYQRVRESSFNMTRGAGMKILKLEA